MGKQGYRRRPKRDRELDQKGAQRRTPMLANGSCCSEKLDVIMQSLHSAERTEKEIAALIKQGGSGHSGKCKFNYSRLRVALMNAHIWDQFGCCIVHHGCLAKRIGVNHVFLASLRSLMIKNARTPLTELSKREVLSRGIVDDVIVPIEFQHLSAKDYLEEIDGDAMVRVPVSKVVSHHGLIGKRSNHSAMEQRSLFAVFIETNRSPSGIACDESVRKNGAAE